jgi:hypothetical protein
LGTRDHKTRDALEGIISVRLGRAARRTEALLRRIDALERRVKELEDKIAVLVKELEDKMAEAEPKPARGGRFRRAQRAEPASAAPAGDPGEGARVVASQMLESGIPPERVAQHLQDVYDLPDAERVVADVAGGER